MTSEGSARHGREDDGVGEPSRRWRVARRLAATPFSFTWAFADWRKFQMDQHQRRRFLRNMNHLYLTIAVAVVLLLGLRRCNGLAQIQQPGWASWSFLPLWFQVSRCNEVFYAFFRDAFDRLDPERRRSSSLTWSERVRLALNSYFELILNFAIIYALVPGDEWVTAPKHLTDVLSYSATTITTSGGGNLIAKHWPLQILTGYEILCGLILLVVCFAIYAGRGVEEVARHDLERERSGNAEGAYRT